MSKDINAEEERNSSFQNITFPPSIQVYSVPRPPPSLNTQIKNKFENGATNYRGSHKDYSSSYQQRKNKNCLGNDNVNEKNCHLNGKKPTDNKPKYLPAQPHQVSKLKASVESRINKVQLINPLGTTSKPDTSNTKSKTVVKYLPGGVPVHAVNENESLAEKKDGVLKRGSDKLMIESDLSEQKAAEYAGFHCSVCDTTLKSFHSYLDHINGRRHLKALGYSAKVSENVTADEVKKQLSHLQEQNRLSNNIKSVEEIQSDYEKKWKMEAEEEQIEKEERKKLKKLDKQLKIKQKKEEEALNIQNDQYGHEDQDSFLKEMQEAGFNFASFSTSRK